MRILTIGKDKEYFRSLSPLFMDPRQIIDEVEDLYEAEYFLEFRSYNVVVLFTNPTESVFLSISEAIKKYDPFCRLIVVASDHSKSNELLAFSLGAYDFISSHSDDDILAERIYSAAYPYCASIMKKGDIVLDTQLETVSFRGKSINLTGKPFHFLLFLVSFEGDIISRERLLSYLWEDPELISPSIIEVNVYEIRKKLDKKFNTVIVESVSRRGYRFCL